MNAAISLEEASSDLAAVVRNVRATKSETVLLEDGVPVAAVIPLAPARTCGELADLWREFRAESRMSMEERNAFADDVEAAHKLMNQPLVYRWD
jgi:antitoxin (DNA-binding transcriptional repressor) of toxin-antitoxin stability system